MITSPVTRMEMAQALGNQLPMTFVEGFDQIRHGRSWTLRNADGEIIVIGGIYRPEWSEFLQMWLVNGSIAKNNMLAAIRAIRLTLEADDYDDVRCWVRSGQGAKIASLCGLKPTGNSKGSLKEWRYG